MFSWTLTPQAPRRRPGRLAVLVIVAVALVVAAAGYVISRAHTYTPPTQRSSAPVPSGGSSGRSDRVNLSGTTWHDFHGIRLPHDRANGPAHTGHHRAWGFADTAGGAVFAAVHIGVRANAQWGPATFTPTIRKQIAGPDKAALMKETESSYEALARKAGVTPGAPVGRAYAIEEAFRVESFTPDAATVDIVTAGPGNDGTTVRAATRIQLTWRRGDWRVLAPPGGDWGATAHTISSLDGYRTFGDEQGGI